MVKAYPVRTATPMPPTNPPRLARRALLSTALAVALATATSPLPQPARAEPLCAARASNVAAYTGTAPSASVTAWNADTTCPAQVTFALWQVEKPDGAVISQGPSVRALYEAGEGAYAEALAQAALEDATFTLAATRSVDVPAGATGVLTLDYPDPCANYLVGAYLGPGTTGPVLDAGFAAPGAGCALAPPATGRLVATYFFYWYDLPRGVHAHELTHRPPDAASYRSVAWFKRQLADMAEAGIDVALASYWGAAEAGSDVGLVNLGRAAAQLRHEGRQVPQTAMFLDTGAVGRWPVEQRDFTRAENRERLYAMVKRFYQALPRDSWAQVDGKPLLWLWAAWFDIRFDNRLFGDLRAWFARDFGADLYIVGESSWRHGADAGGPGAMQLDAFYEWGAALYGYRPVNGGVAQVGPGYDERGLGGPARSGRHASREGGAFYERNLQAAVASPNRFLAIETWNEYHEASDVAESLEQGRRYIELTRIYADRFKAGGR